MAIKSAIVVREAERSELRERFAAEAAQSEQDTLSSGKTYSRTPAFVYLDKRIAGTNVRRPIAHAWREPKKAGAMRDEHLFDFIAEETSLEPASSF
jgi:hypothetical protein